MAEPQTHPGYRLFRNRLADVLRINFRSNAQNALQNYNRIFDALVKEKLHYFHFSFCLDLYFFNSSSTFSKFLLASHHSDVFMPVFAVL